MRPRHLLVNTITGLEVGCIVGVFWLGARILPVAPAPTRTEPEPAPVEPVAVPMPMLDGEEPIAPDRIPCALDAGELPEPVIAAAPASADRRKERDYYKAFVRIAARGNGELERLARLVIAGKGPDCEKVAALRAVRDTGCPAAYDILAAAVETLPDASRSEGDSVPFFAVRVLAGRASHVDRARQALERVAWNTNVPSELRRAAVAGLAAVIDEAGAWRIVSRLGFEQDECVRESAARALARNAAAESAAAAAAQWIPSSPVDGEAGEQQE